ncbi:MAG: hypothetical protein RSE39_06530, partial [Oscillospiraceae bacterium]
MEFPATFCFKISGSGTGIFGSALCSWDFEDTGVCSSTGFDGSSTGELIHKRSSISSIDQFFAEDL